MKLLITVATILVGFAAVAMAESSSWLVMLKVNCNNTKTKCFGILVASDRAISPASCFDKCNPNNIRDVKILGVNSIKDDSANINAKLFNFKTVTLHKDYNNSVDKGTTNDIAVIELKSHSHNVTTLTLTNKCKPKIDQDLSLLEFDVDNGKSLSQTPVKVNKPRVCKAVYQSGYYDKLKHYCVCAPKCLSGISYGIIYDESTLLFYSFLNSPQLYCKDGGKSTAIAALKMCSTFDWIKCQISADKKDGCQEKPTALSVFQLPPPQPVVTVIGCANPPPVLNALVQSAMAPVQGDKATYSCVPPFKLVGNNFLTCKNGAWEGKKPQCKGCKDLLLPHGTITYYEHAGGRIADFTCDKNYKLKGAATVSCNGDKWSDAAPTCKDILCPVPENIPIGRVHYTKKTCGSIVAYSCPSGYIVDGAIQRQCNCPHNHGNWDLTPPKCVLKKSVLCPPYKNLDCGSTRNSGGTVIGAKVTFTPQANVELVGPSEITCQPRGTWSGPTPQCRLLCDMKEVTMENGGFNFIKDDKTMAYTMEMSCNHGYTMNGPGLYKCNNGQWTQNPYTQCLKQCPKLTIHNGSVRVYSATVSRIICNRGYRTITSPIVRCNSQTLTWSTIPKCVPV